MKSKLSKILIILVAIMLFIPTQLIQVLATEVGDSAYLERGDKGFYSVQYLNSKTGNWTYITYSRTFYTDENGVRRIAYCVDQDLKGIGWISGEEEGYNVNLTEALSNEKLWRVYRYGYPYVSPEELGVETEDDAYLATKQAGYWVIKGGSLDDIYNYYRAGQEVINGENLTDIQRRGQKVINAIYHLVDLGYNGTETPKYNDLIKVNASGKFSRDENTEYYSQKYIVESTTNITEYTVEKLESFPEGTYIADLNGNEKTTFSADEEFKVMVPKNSIINNEIGEITIRGKCQNYPVYYGKAEIEGKQNYAVTVESITEENEIVSLKMQDNKSQIQIIKVDLDNNEVPLKDVEFEVTDKQGNVLEKIKTDENGKAVTKRYFVDDYKELYIKETTTNENYVLDDTVHKIELKENQIVNVTFENEKIKGNIKVIKTAEEDNKITGDKKGDTIANVKFKIYDENKNHIETITTNETGEAISSLLEKGKYYIKEDEASEWYILNENEYTAEIINNGDVVEIDITNVPENPNVDIEKTGIIQTTANEEIKYDFNIKNTGNVALNNFIWTDELPTDYVRITKLVTGTYNQDLEYSIYYKTNKNDYKLLKEKLSTNVNNYIDFTNIELEEDEYITDFKVDFGTIDVGFTSVINPYVFVKVNSNVKNNDTFTNKTRLEGYNKTYMVWDEDEHTTKIYEKQVEVKKLPRTGM